MGAISYIPPAALVNTQTAIMGPPGTVPSAGSCGAGGGGSAAAAPGSTTNPNTQAAAPIGASSGISSPQPPNRAGFLGLRGGAGVGDGWPSGGWAPPGTSVPGASSTAGRAGTSGTRVRSSGQGDPTLYTMEAATGRLAGNTQGQNGALWILLAAAVVFFLFVE